MKLNKISNVILFALVLTIPTVGCRKKYAGVTPLPGAAHTGTASAGDTSPGKPLIDDGLKPASDNVGSTAITDPDVRKNWPRDREIFKSDTVHFEYDSSVIKTDEKSKVAAVADYLKGNAQDALEIEGHCDARGTEEYNRSLGERRALALREELIRLGVEPSRLDTVSFGEDRPADPGHDESAYRKNRRGEFLLEKHQTLVGLNSPFNNDPTK